MSSPIAEGIDATRIYVLFAALVALMVFFVVRSLN